MEVDEGVKPLPLNTSPQALTTSATSEELLNLEYEGLHSICFSCGRPKIWSHVYKLPFDYKHDSTPRLQKATNTNDQNIDEEIIRHIKISTIKKN